jgi:hypothetical protein
MPKSSQGHRAEQSRPDFPNLLADGKVKARPQAKERPAGANSMKMPFFECCNRREA